MKHPSLHAGWLGIKSERQTRHAEYIEELSFVRTDPFPDVPANGSFGNGSFNGSLERVNRSWPGTTNKSLDIPRYRITWEPKALSSSGEDFSTLSNLIVGVESTNSSAYLSNVENQVDYEQWMRVLAFERAVCNFDSYGYHNGQNMFAYHDLKNGQKWKLLMTDFDTVFSYGLSDSFNGVWVNADPFYNADSSIVAREPRVEDMKNIPVFRRAFWRCLYDLANTNDGVFLPSFIGPIFSGNQAVLLTNGYTQPTATNDQRLDLTWIANRRAYLWGRLPEARPSFLAGIQTFNTNTYFATLTGTAPVEVKGFKINGNVMAVTWTTVTNWSLSGTLPTGTLTLSGFDRKTNELPVRDKGDYTTNLTVFP